MKTHLVLYKVFKGYEHYTNSVTCQGFDKLKHFTISSVFAYFPNVATYALWSFLKVHYFNPITWIHVYKFWTYIVCGFIPCKKPSVIADWSKSNNEDYAYYNTSQYLFAAEKKFRFQLNSGLSQKLIWQVFCQR